MGGASRAGGPPANQGYSADGGGHGAAGPVPSIPEGPPAAQHTPPQRCTHPHYPFTGFQNNTPKEVCDTLDASDTLDARDRRALLACLPDGCMHACMGLVHSAEVATGAVAAVQPQACSSASPGLSVMKGCQPGNSGVHAAEQAVAMIAARELKQFFLRGIDYLLLL